MAAVLSDGSAHKLSDDSIRSLGDADPQWWWWLGSRLSDNGGNDYLYCEHTSTSGGGGHARRRQIGNCQSAMLFLTSMDLKMTTYALSRQLHRWPQCKDCMWWGISRICDSVLAVLDPDFQFFFFCFEKYFRWQVSLRSCQLKSYFIGDHLSLVTYESRFSLVADRPLVNMYYFHWP